MEFLKKADRYYQTLSRLRWKQIRYSAAARLFPPKTLRRVSAGAVTIHPLPPTPVVLEEPVLEMNEYGYHFTILNKNRLYKNQIDWTDQSHGRLWNYNLQYAGFLLQDNPGQKIKSELICHLYEQLFRGTVPPEPYPASLRSMNVIRWLSGAIKNGFQPSEALKTGLVSELHFIAGHPEYHLLGNHLLENAFALLMGGYFLNQQNLITKAEEIFQTELTEQFLEDGAHFERSVMYHQVMTARLIEAASYLPEDTPLSVTMQEMIPQTLSWLRGMTFQNGDIANFNDCTYTTSHQSQPIFDAAKSHDYTPGNQPTFIDSGFRKLKNATFELIAAIGGMEPDYLPAHIHADTFSFILHVQGQPVVADPGISLYEAGPQRILERSTPYHNTVTRNELNTADVWHSFRAGRRPRITVLTDEPANVRASLTCKPFSEKPFTHTRQFSLHADSLEIADTVGGSDKVTGRMNLHPGVLVQQQTENMIVLTGGLKITFENVQKLEIVEYLFNETWNKQEAALSILYHFTTHCTLRFEAARL